VPLFCDPTSSVIEIENSKPPFGNKIVLGTMQLNTTQSSPNAAARPNHGFQPRGEGGFWNVWAPKLRTVDLVLLDGGERKVLPMKSIGDGWFRYTADQVRTGQRYLFRLDGDVERPDPASRWQPDGVHAPSAIWRPSERQRDEPARTALGLEDMVIYELHVGTFTQQGTFDAVISRLAELRDFGITTIELMPVGQFPGDRGWGYDGTYWFAPQQSYGGPAGLERLVTACHDHGLGVILDVIYNHLGPEGNYLHPFGPYFTNRYNTPWGEAINFDGEGREGARSLVLDSVRSWIRDFRFDGLRLDAVWAIHDKSRPHILAEIGQVAAEERRLQNRSIHIIAETHYRNVWLLDSLEQGGCGLSGQWSDDFHHSVHALLTDERDGYYARYTAPPKQLVTVLNDVFVSEGMPSTFRADGYDCTTGAHGGEKFVVCIQNHDQVGNRALGERLGSLIPPNKQRLAACMLLLAPHVPLIFMGEEYDEQRPFPFFCDFGDVDLQEAVRRGRREEFKNFDWCDQIPDPLSYSTFELAQLSWTWPEGTRRAGLRRLYSDLLKLRRAQAGLRDFRHRKAHLSDAEDGKQLLWLRRGKPEVGVTCLFNLGAASEEIPELSHNLPILFRSEEERYAGEPSESKEPSPTGLSLRPYECVIFLSKEEQQTLDLTETTAGSQE
jgi:maltooligosyltrehalose trehalohydrolase